VAVILVEGITDRLALEAVAARLGLDLRGVEIVPIGGAQAVRRAAAEYEGEHVVGMCDAGEQRKMLEPDEIPPPLAGVLAAAA
jgi:hypothetical protein